MLCVFWFIYGVVYIVCASCTNTINQSSIKYLNFIKHQKSMKWKTPWEYTHIYIWHPAVCVCVCECKHK